MIRLFKDNLERYFRMNGIVLKKDQTLFEWVQTLADKDGLAWLPLRLRQALPMVALTDIRIWRQWQEDGCLFAAPTTRLIQAIGQNREQFSRFTTFSWELQMSGYPMEGLILEMTEDMLQQLRLVQMLAGTQYWVDTCVPSEERCPV